MIFDVQIKIRFSQVYGIFDVNIWGGYEQYFTQKQGLFG